ncbi:MAG TPA: histidine phosphatase family protein [Ilumatobacter sp.]|nr:histidine phosphatase family protein [Ilumatobacter sp.]
MDRHLILVRHAKSAWDDPSLSDHDRPLAPRGIKALPRLRDHLAGVEHRPELVLCSSSRRTVETLEGVRAALPTSARVDVDDALYGASDNVLLALLRAIEENIRCAMVIGHNPGLQDLAVLLVGAGDRDLRAQLEAKFPTSAAATLSFQRDWNQLDPGSARLDDVFMPRPPEQAASAS